MTEERKNRLVQLKINVETGFANYGEAYEERLRQFVNGYEFMKLGQAVNRTQWQSAAMCAARMSKEAEKLGLECFQRQFTGLRQNIARKEIQETKNILSLVVIKRIQIQDALKDCDI